MTMTSGCSISGCCSLVFLLLCIHPGIEGKKEVVIFLNSFLFVFAFDVTFIVSRL